MSFKKIKTLKALKKYLQKSLPEKVSRVIQSYDDFASRPVAEDAKSFSAHHSACRSAVVHAETLLKLAKWTDEEASAPPASSSPEDDVMELLAAARSELDEFNDDED